MPLVETTHTLNGELDQKPLRISYRTFHRVPGQPGVLEPAFLPATVLTITHDGPDATFEGGQLETTALQIGTMVTVKLMTVPDLGSSTLSLLLPAMADDPADGRSELHTIVIRTQYNDGFTGPNKHGQLSSYTAVKVHGEVTQQPIATNVQ